MRFTNYDQDWQRVGFEFQSDAPPYAYSPGLNAEAALAMASPSILSEAGAFRVEDSTSRRVHLALKRLFDLSGALFGVLLLAPVLLAIAIAIKVTSRGPVLFRQTRVGLGNQPFEIFKFRSMYTDRCDVTGVAQTVAGDARITPVGRLLRKTNLDELPQLLNVLRGDMSLVGPRPHVPGMLAAGMLYEDLVPTYPARHAMRPGITGLAQVNGFRGPTTEPAPAIGRVKNDLAYIESFSIWLDISILFRTIINEIRGGSGF